MSSQATRIRSLYRRFLREMPAHSPSLLANRSPLQEQIRANFSADASADEQSSQTAEQRLAEAEQHLHYMQAQRQYITLVERYNPGANMTEEEKVRLSARRVGMNLPVERLPRPFRKQ